MKIRNLRSYSVGPVGLDGLTVEPGEFVEVPDEFGEKALEQTDAWGSSKSRKSVDDGTEKEN